jgi:gas vesicle protein
MENKTEKIERQNERKQIREAFKVKSNEMKRLIKEAHITYYDGIKLNKKKNKDDLKQIKSQLKTALGKIHTDFDNKTISFDERNHLVSEAKKTYAEELTQ